MTRVCEPDELPDIPADDATAHRMLAGNDEVPSVHGDEQDRTSALLHPNGVPPRWMIAHLARLASAFPAFSFTISRGWRGLRFEAWCDPAASALYAVITDDPRELWHELEAAQR